MFRRSFGTLHLDLNVNSNNKYLCLEYLAKKLLAATIDTEFSGLHLTFIYKLKELLQMTNNTLKPNVFGNIIFHITEYHTRYNHDRNISQYPRVELLFEFLVAPSIDLEGSYFACAAEEGAKEGFVDGLPSVASCRSVEFASAREM